MDAIRRAWRGLLVLALIAAAGAQTGVTAAAGAQTGVTAAAGPSLRDATPPYYYASFHPRIAWAGANVLKLEFDYRGPETMAGLTVDVSGIDGVADITGGADGCHPAAPVFHCTPRLTDEWAQQELIVKPAAGARPGDHGVLRYTLEVPGQPALHASVTVIAGRPELRVNTGGRVGVKDVGESFDVPVLIRNMGDVPARGVDFMLDSGGTMALTGVRHSNCRYAGGTAMDCRFPDVEIGPGETFRISPGRRLKPVGRAIDAVVSYGAWAFHTGYRRSVEGATTPGTAAPLALTEDPSGGAGVEFSPNFDPVDVAVAVRNTTDTEAFGASLHGAVGSVHRIRFGFRINGPGEPRAARTRAVFTVPPGAKVVQAPYDAEREEEMLPQLCKKEDGGRRYVCTESAGLGRTVTFGFTLRIERKDDRPGSVVVSTSLLGHRDDTPVRDRKPANNMAPVRMDVAGAPRPAAGSGLSTATWTSGAAVASVGAAVLLVVVRRRRGATSSGTSGTPPPPDP